MEIQKSLIQVDRYPLSLPPVFVLSFLTSAIHLFLTLLLFNHIFGKTSQATKTLALSWDNCGLPDGFVRPVFENIESSGILESEI